MIFLKRMKVNHSNQITFSSNKIYSDVYFGHLIEIDDRVKWIAEYAKALSEKKSNVRYIQNDARIVFEGDVNENISVLNLDSLRKPSGKILFDATSLLFPELLYLMTWANTIGCDFDVIYVEPEAYTRKPYKASIGSHKLDYSLSEDGPGILLLPKFVYPVDQSHLVFALGYEGHRFGSFLLSDEVSPKNITALLGVPPFELGWERNTYAKNYSMMEQAKREYPDSEFITASANDPLQNYLLLKRIRKSIASITGPRQKLQLVPIGTKPVALAMAWFATNYSETGILYDFVNKKQGRSEGVGKVHWWRFTIKQSDG